MRREIVVESVGRVGDFIAEVVGQRLEWRHASDRFVGFLPSCPEKLRIGEARLTHEVEFVATLPVLRTGRLVILRIVRGFEGVHAHQPEAQARGPD